MIQLNIQSPDFQKTLPRTLTIAGVTLLVYLAFGTTSRIVEDLLSPLATDPASESSEFQSLAIAAIVTLIWTVFSSSAQLTFLARLTYPRSPAFSAQSALGVINLIAIESTRSLSACIFRIPLFIVPAIVEWFRLMPVSYLVLLDQDYNLGKVDALKASRRFFSANKLFVIALTLPLILGVSLELFVTDSPIDAIPFWQAPFQHIGSIGMIAALRLAIDFGILWSYRQKLGLYSNSIS